MHPSNDSEFCDISWIQWTTGLQDTNGVFLHTRMVLQHSTVLAGHATPPPLFRPRRRKSASELQTNCGYLAAHLRYDPILGFDIETLIRTRSIKLVLVTIYYNP